MDQETRGLPVTAEMVAGLFLVGMALLLVLPGLIDTVKRHRSGA